jgi:hypothetical protein
MISGALAGREAKGALEVVLQVLLDSVVVEQRVVDVDQINDVVRLARHSISGSGDSAGPAITFPSGWNREPWHGQSHVRSASFHSTVHPM